MQSLEALPGGNVPHFDGGVGIAADKDVVPQLHAAGQRLMADEGVQARARLRTPHAD